MVSDEPKTPRSEPHCRVLAAVLFAAAGLVLGDCSGGRPAGPLSGESSALGIRIETHWADPDAATEYPDTVYFIRVGEGAKAVAQRKILVSNHRAGNQIYLLNARPGRYMVVAASETVRSKAPQSSVRPLGGLDEFRVFTSYFDGPLAEGTAIVLAPGAFRMVAWLSVEVDSDIEEGDETQLHFHPLVDRKLTDPFGNPIVDPDNSIALRASLKERSAGGATEADFLREALKHLEGTGWERAIRRRQEALGK